jgi:small-conductance mechanosensitive channel
VRTMFDYGVVHWTSIVIPLAVFAVSIIILFWLRKIILVWLNAWAARKNRLGGDFFNASMRSPFAILCLILSVFAAMSVSSIPADVKGLTGNGLWSLLAIAAAVTLHNTVVRAMVLYRREFYITTSNISATRNAVRSVILVVLLLAILGIWGVPTIPVLLLIAAIIIVGLIAFRDTAPNLFAGFHISTTRQIKIGDYIQLETCEGWVSEIGWNNTCLKSPDGCTVLIPNHILVHRKITNCGQTLKKDS